jgi:AcrR family transcriptional regulator
MYPIHERTDTLVYRQFERRVAGSATAPGGAPPMTSSTTGAAVAPHADGGRGATGEAGDAAAREGARRRRTRERLIDAAYEVFAEHGVHAATVEQITERAGFTRGAFYSNFTTKEELFFALMEREHGLRLDALREGVAVLQPQVEAALAPLDEAALGKAIIDLLGSFDDHRWCVVQSEFRLLAMRDRAVAPQLLDQQERFMDSLTPIVQAAVAAAGREFVLEERVALVVLAGIYEAALQSSILAGQDVRTVAQVRTDLARTVLALTRPVEG